MTKLKIIVGATLLSVSVSAMAATPGRTAVGTFTQVFASKSGGAFVSFNTNKLADGTTVCSENLRYKIDGAEPGSNGLLAAALTAKVTDSNVQMDIVDCDVPDPRISNLILK